MTKTNHSRKHYPDIRLKQLWYNISTTDTRQPPTPILGPTTTIPCCCCYAHVRLSLIPYPFKSSRH